MTSFKWREEASQIFGVIKRPIAQTYIKDTKGNWRAITLYIDSGADVTILSRSFGELLGFKVKSGRPAEFKGFGANKIHAYLHDMEIKIGNNSVKTKVAVCDSDDSVNVLGRYGIFDRYVISFLNGKQKTAMNFKS
jgi:hypothetical protein